MMEWIYKRIRVGFLYACVLLYQKLNHTLIMNGKDSFELRYLLHDRLYKIKIRSKRGPNLIRIQDETGADRTDDVLAYLGPNHDCHGQKLTPRDLGYTKLIFHGKTDRIVDTDDII